MTETVTTRETNRKPIPVYILVGFLGSGKTTLLGQLLSWALANQLKPGLILNEIGSAWIDAAAVRREGLELTELPEGCICCTAEEDLIPALTKMAANPQIDLILLEASGLADPADMLDTLTDQALWQVVEVGGTISVLDSPRWQDLAAQNKLARRQVQYADVLVMNKCDLLSETAQADLACQLAEIAPRARIFPAAHGLPYAGIEALLQHSLAVGRNRFQKQREIIARALKIPVHLVPVEALPPSATSETSGHASLSIHVQTIDFEQPLNKLLFEDFLKSLPPTVYRAKGFVKIKDSDKLHMFQHLPGFSKVLPIATYQPPALRGVFIGQNLDPNWLQTQVAKCQH